MADKTYRRSGRDQYDFDRNYNRQEEQFDSTEQGWRDEERGYAQMGEGSWRDEAGQHETYGQPTRRSRERGYARPTDFGRDFNREPASSYPTGRYGPNPYERETPGFASFTSSDYGGRDFSAPRYTGSDRYAGSFGGYGAGTMLAEGRGEWRDDGRRAYRESRYRDRNDRGWFERAGDEVASWFGDEDAARRRERDYSGHGPTGYVRSDERILEDVNDALTDDWGVDARKIQVTVRDGDVTLDGTVPSRAQKRRAEDCVEDLSGVKNVQNNLRVEQAVTWSRNNTADTETTGSI